MPTKKSKVSSTVIVCFMLLLFLNSRAQDTTPTQEEFFELIRSQGVVKAVEVFNQVRENDPDAVIFTEEAMNSLGYEYLRAQKVQDAIELFKLNVRAYPEAFNVYDSLGEAYMTNGDTELAIRNYKRSVELNPDNINGYRFAYVLEHYAKYEYRIPMRDGVKLFTSVYVPKDTSVSYPIMFKRTPYSVSPYGENRYMSFLGPSWLFTEEGYVFVYQDVRGRFMSEGEFINMTPHQPIKESQAVIDESTDTYDTIEWLLQNIPNNNRRVGLWGISYPGFYAAMGTIDAHPALVAVSPQAPIADWFIGDDMHHHGAFSLLLGFNFFSIFGQPRTELTTKWPSKLDYASPDAYTFFLKMGPLANANKKYFKGEITFWNEAMKHETYDDFWKSRSTLQHFKQIKPAVMTVGGWFDGEDLYGALHTYKAIEERNTDVYNILVMGPWRHGGWARSEGESFGELHFRSKTSEYYRENIELPFFNYYLKDKGDLNLPEITAFETGTNKWNSFDEWPPKNTQETKLYFHSNQTLAFEAPEEKEPTVFDEYVSDPNKPVPYTAKILDSKSFYYAEYMVEDQRFAASRPDVLVYESQPITENMTIAGPIRAELYVSTSGTDADWVVKLIDVFPDDAADPVPNTNNVEMGGYQMMVRGEIMRGKFRNSYENPEAFEPNKVAKVEFVLQDAHHTFLEGHKIMVQVQNSWFPLFDRNPQKFADIYQATEDDFQKATHRVYRSNEFPSNLRVNVVQ